LEILRPRRFGDFGILRSLRFTNRRFWRFWEIKDFTTLKY
jgi:hypothetical protein